MEWKPVTKMFVILSRFVDIFCFWKRKTACLPCMWLFFTINWNLQHGYWMKVFCFCFFKKKNNLFPAGADIDGTENENLYTALHLMIQSWSKMPVGFFKIFFVFFKKRGKLGQYCLVDQKRSWLGSSSFKSWFAIVDINFFFWPKTVSTGERPIDLVEKYGSNRITMKFKGASIGILFLFFLNQTTKLSDLCEEMKGRRVVDKKEASRPKAVVTQKFTSKNLPDVGALWFLASRFFCVGRRCFVQQQQQQQQQHSVVVCRCCAICASCEWWVFFAGSCWRAVHQRATTTLRRPAWRWCAPSNCLSRRATTATRRAPALRAIEFSVCISRISHRWPTRWLACRHKFRSEAGVADWRKSSLFLVGSGQWESNCASKRRAGLRDGWQGAGGASRQRNGRHKVYASGRLARQAL